MSNPARDMIRRGSGGILFTHRAHIMCARCCEFENFFASADMEAGKFRTKARRHFRAAGWIVGRGAHKTLCPNHA